MVAYLIYDKETLAIESIQWSPSDGPSMRISDEEALEFMSGQRSLLDYQLISTGKGLKISKIEVNIPLPAFWKLARTTEAEGLTFTFRKNHFFVEANDGTSFPYYLFATLKDDPTWLVCSWDLSSRKRDKKGRIRLELENASNHSFYVSKSNEASNT